MCVDGVLVVHGIDIDEPRRIRVVDVFWYGELEFEFSSHNAVRTAEENLGAVAIDICRISFASVVLPADDAFLVVAHGNGHNAVEVV